MSAPTERRTSSRNASKKIGGVAKDVEVVADAAAASVSTSSFKRRGADDGDVDKVESSKKSKGAEMDLKSALNGDQSESKGLLSTGSSLPAVTLKDENGSDVDVTKLRKTILFTYPKANTPGCTTQACLYRDEYSSFQKAGFQVYGLSSDGQTSLKSWKEKKGFGYSLLSDPKRQLIGPLTGSTTSTIRSHFVIDAGGKLALSAVKVKPVESSPATLKFAQSLS